jgi:hypothetical protein
MKETIKQIRDFATATDNIYLLNKIILLEKQIEISIIDAKIEASSIIINNQLNN